MQFFLSRLLSSNTSNSRRGMSIMAVLIAAAVMAVIMAAFTSFTNNSNQSLRKLQNSVDFNLLTANITQAVIHNDDTCKGAFWDASNDLAAFDGTNTTHLGSIKVGRDPANPVTNPGTNLLVMGQSLPGAMKVSMIDLEVVSGTPVTTVGTLSKYTAMLRIKVSRADNFGGKAEFEKEFLLGGIVADSSVANKIVDCQNAPATTSLANVQCPIATPIMNGFDSVGAPICLAMPAAGSALPPSNTISGIPDPRDSCGANGSTAVSMRNATCLSRCNAQGYATGSWNSQCQHKMISCSCTL